MKNINEKKKITEGEELIITGIKNDIESLKSEKNDGFNFYLLNTFDNNRVKINSTYDGYCEFVKCLLSDKIKKKPLTDIQFLDKIKRSKKKYYYQIWYTYLFIFFIQAVCLFFCEFINISGD